MLNPGRLAGAASPASTAAYAGRYQATLGARAYSRLGATGLTVSRLGFGGYRVDDETPTHRAALEQALTVGVNVIDTSTNYTDGGSERLVGAVLADLVARGTLAREEVVVVSKIGYVQGQNLKLAREREAEGRPFPEMVRYMDGCWHCVHPDFLADQLTRSLDRLRLGTLDVCLLHNPEYFLADAKRRSHGSLATLRDEFYRRLREAFRFFETEVVAGRLRSYGVSSNTCTAPADDPEATALTRMLEAAHEAGGARHHLRVLQLPMNLFESGALFERNNSATDPTTAPSSGRDAHADARSASMQRTVLGVASHAGLGVLVNRPLNAAVGDALLRLADFRRPPGARDLDEQLDIVRRLEAEYRSQIAPQVRAAAGAAEAADMIRWAEHLESLGDAIESVEQWQQIESYRVLPRLSHALRTLDRDLTGAAGDRWRDWRARYVAEFGGLLEAFHAIAATRSQERSRMVAAAIDTGLAEARRSESLSRKALWVVASTPGVTTVLLGMRRPEYVTDGVGMLGWPPLPDVRPVYEAVKKLIEPRERA
jgi:uncharacterized protein